MKQLFSPIFVFLFISACAQIPKNSQDPMTAKDNTDRMAARAVMKSKSGSSVKGLLTISQLDKGIRVEGEITGLKPQSQHGFHIHEKSDCSADDASSAGGHFNPKGKKHGSPKDKSHHSGDLGNIQADGNGKVKINQVLNDVTLYPMNNDLSVLGKSFVVHSNMDDLKSQPSGNAGKRIACGSIKF